MGMRIGSLEIIETYYDRLQIFFFYKQIKLSNKSETNLKVEWPLDKIYPKKSENICQ